MELRTRSIKHIKEKAWPSQAFLYLKRCFAGRDGRTCPHGYTITACENPGVCRLLSQHRAEIGLAAIWLAFAPLKLGGRVSYVMVNGISMEPGFHTGDPAIMRQAANYQVGDIVAYADAQMHANVIHRIIGVEEDQFVLKGDNNS